MKKTLCSVNTTSCSIFRSILLVFLLTTFNEKINAQKDLDVIKDNWLEYSDAPNSLYHYLSGQCYDLLDKREKSVSQIKYTRRVAGKTKIYP